MKLACQRDIAVGLKPWVMPQEESRYANQSTASTRQCQNRLFSSQVVPPRNELSDVPSASLARAAKLVIRGARNYLNMPTDRNANRQPSMPRG